MQKLVIIVGMFVVLSAGIASADSIYVNDFGTTNQKTVGGTGDWDSEVKTPHAPVGEYIPSVTLIYFTNGWNNISQDQDGDSLHGALSLEGWGGYRLIQRIDAAAGFRLSDIFLQINGHAAEYQHCLMGVALSDDGVTWDYSATRTGSWSVWPDKTVNITSGTDADYTDIASVWIAVDLYNGDNLWAQPWYSAYLTDVIVLATVVPARGTLIIIQ